MIDPRRFETLAGPLIAAAEALTLKAIGALTRLSFALSSDPESITGATIAFESAMSRAVDAWQRAGKDWAGDELATAYLMGVNDAERTLARAGLRDRGGRLPARQVFGSGGGGAVPPGTTARFGAAGAGNHTTLYGVFMAATEDQLGRTAVPVLRQSRDVFRQIAIQAGTPGYRDAERFTRLRFSQDILDRFADRGIAAVTYSDGRRVPVDVYAEMLGRTQTQHAAMQASLNRYSERGYDLVRMSTHSRSSPMCEPWQGGIYSQSGASEQYDSLETAINGGAFHPNCLHALSLYVPGVSLPIEDRAHPREAEIGDKAAYEAQQRQREMERHVRRWKRREEAAVTPEAAEKAKAKVREWQGQVRNHLDEHPYLPRKREREQIKRAH